MIIKSYLDKRNPETLPFLVFLAKRGLRVLAYILFLIIFICVIVAYPLTTMIGFIVGGLIFWFLIASWNDYFNGKNP